MIGNNEDLTRLLDIRGAESAIWCTQSGRSVTHGDLGKYFVEHLPVPAGYSKQIGHARNEHIAESHAAVSHPCRVVHSNCQLANITERSRPILENQLLRDRPAPGGPVFDPLIGDFAVPRIGQHESVCRTIKYNGKSPSTPTTKGARRAHKIDGAIGVMSHYRTAEQVKSEFGARPRRALFITTVACESHAVNAHLIDLEKIAGANGAIYQMGVFPDPTGDWQVIHAITHAGNSDAAMVATKAHGEIGKFDVQMFVGVAGSLKEDIPIGSVVVGQYVYNSEAGKVENEGYSSRPQGHAGAPELLKAAQIAILDEDWITFIKSSKSGKLPAISDYPCPYPPLAIVKSIASGEKVIAGGKTRAYKIIRERYNDAGAVEMEGFGAMNAAYQEGTSAIVVRGISDMCDGKDHTSDAQHQPIASAHAAAFAFSILSIRSKASPLSPGGSALPVQPIEITHELPEDNHDGSAIDSRVDFVVNFKGTRSEWVPERIESFIEGMRNLTGDAELSFERIDDGSVRLVVKVREKDIPVLTLQALRTVAGDAAGKLLGAVTAEELIEAQEARMEFKRASAALLSWEQTLPGGGWLERPEKQEIENRFHSEFSSTVLLGEPGSGKSALLAAIATDLINAEASVLAIKADLLTPQVHNEKDLQVHLDLPALPGELVERLARFQPVFVFIDQLDALASQLDLQSDRLNVLLNLVRRVGGLPNVHVILSARTFEFNHDVRLRAVDAEAVTLTLPAWHEVKQKLDAVGVDADTWPENARELVRNPQALKTFILLGKDKDKGKDNLPFTKYQSMLEQLWRQKIATAPNSEALASLASDLAGTMAEEESLWLAASRFDARAPALENLESVGVIVRSNNGKSVAFSHQTVFDYVLARSFVRAAGRLSSYVIERQNSLFVRAKLWSALSYLRDAEITSYKREFLEIWQRQDLRRHLRLLLIEFLGEIHDPVAFEKVCFEEVLASMDLRLSGLKAIIGSPGWFANFAHSAVPSAMVGIDSEANQALRILQKAWAFAADDVVRLLREQWLNSPEKDGFAWAALDACTAWTARVEEVAHAILSRTPISAWQVDYTASVLAVEQPDIALRLMRAKLDFLLEKARATPEGKAFPQNGTDAEQVAWQMSNSPTKPFKAILESTEWNSLSAIAEACPQQFLDVLWPWFRDIFNELRIRERQDESPATYPGLYSVDVFLGRAESDRLGPEHPVLSSLRLAIEGTACKNPTYFTNWVEANQDLEYMAAQRLVAHGFSLAPEVFAEQAFKWLLADLRRLQLGDMHGTRLTTASLISAVSPFWSEELIREFESKIQKYRPAVPVHVTDVKQRRSFSKFIRRTKAHLLAAIPLPRLSEKSQKLIATEKRALGEDLDSGMHHVSSGMIGSPMSAEEMAKAKDRDILRMFKDVPDDTNWDHPQRWMRGGNIQLSRAFSEYAKKDPTRALRIMEQFEPHIQERAAGYALESIAELAGNDQEVQAAILDLHQRGFGTTEFRSSAASAVDKISKRPTQVDAYLVDVLVDWLSGPVTSTEASDDEDASERNESGDQSRSKEDARHDSILWGHGGLSILPAGNFPILSALTSVLLTQKEVGRDRLIRILEVHLSREKNPKVWQALLIRLSNAGGSTPEGLSNFLRALFTRHPALLETREAVYFFAYAYQWDEVLVHDLIVTWEHAANPLLRQAQGELVGLISTVQGSIRWTAMREQLLTQGSAEAKVGMAYAGANLWSETQFHRDAGTLLERLIPGADNYRMSAILDVFRLCGDLVPEPTTLALLRAIAAPDVDVAGAPSNFVVERLQSLLPHAADVVGVIALKLVTAWSNGLGDSQTATSLVAPQLTDLAITLHRLGGESRETGVAVFEKLIEIDAYGARDTLTEIDGRFGYRQTGARRRIARRRANRAESRTL